ncbi:MAG: PKD-like family lipoprotein [Odoribacter sp.]
MKTLKYITILLFITDLFTFQSCYEDKGNYNYQDIGSIKVEQPGDIQESSFSQSIMQDDTLKIVPILNLNKLKESDLVFVWDYAVRSAKNPKFIELSRERNLKAKCIMVTGQYDLRLKITDVNTDVSTYAYYILTVNSVTTRSMMLLCKVSENEYDISTCPLDAMRGSIVYQIGKDLYSARNGRTLKNAVKLVYWNNLKSEQLLWALQENGGETLSGFDLTYHGDAKDWFFETPVNIRPTNIYGDVKGKEYFILSDGGIYFVDNQLAPPFKARMREKVSDNLDYKVQAAAYISVNKARRYAFWDEKNSRFLQWDYNAGSLITFKSPDLVADPNNFDPNNLEGMTPLYLGGGFDGARSGGSASYSFFKGTDGNIHMYTFTGTATSIAPKEHRILDASIGLDRADCICAFSMYHMIYYAIDNVVYVFEPNSPIGAHRAVYTDPDDKMRFISMVSNLNFSQLFVSGNKNGVGYMYRMYMDASGDLTEPSTSRPEVIQQVGPFREIKNMEILFKDY